MTFVLTENNPAQTELGEVAAATPPVQATQGVSLEKVQAALGLEQPVLMELLQRLSLRPRIDQTTGGWLFTPQEITLIHRAAQLHGFLPMTEPVSMANHLSQAPSVPLAPPPAASSLTAAKPTLHQPAPVTAAVAIERQLRSLGQAVETSKTQLVQELGQLIDDRLSGLDEVVVELIRCKTENDSLRQKLAATLKEKDALQNELSRFETVGLGFYRKY